KFQEFLEDSIQQSHEIRKYVSNLRLVIKCFSEQNVSDDNFQDLESLLEDTQRNLKSSEILMGKANIVKNELVKIRYNLDEYKSDVQSNPKNIKSKTKDELNKIEDEIRSSNRWITAGSATVGGGAVLTAISVALAPFTAGASIAIEAAVVGIIVGAASIGGGAAAAIKEGISKHKNSARSEDVKGKLEEEKSELISIIERMENDLESIVATIGKLIGYWEVQKETISGLLEKVNAASNSGRSSNMIIRAIDQSSKELELDELYAKDFCITIRGLLANDQARFNS
ncbi:11804_t:CDS:2, partial [Scutellospora calospora]